MLRYKSADDLFQLHVYKKGGSGPPGPPPPPGSAPELSVLAEALETQLLKFGVIASVKLSSESGVHGENVMLIQRFDEKWQAFLNVDQTKQICNGDRLTVVPKPIMSSPNPVASKVSMMSLVILHTFLPTRASEQGNVIGYVRIYIHTVKPLSNGHFGTNINSSDLSPV